MRVSGRALSASIALCFVIGMAAAQEEQATNSGYEEIQQLLIDSGDLSELESLEVIRDLENLEDLLGTPGPAVSIPPDFTPAPDGPPDRPLPPIRTPDQNPYIRPVDIEEALKQLELLTGERVYVELMAALLGNAAALQCSTSAESFVGVWDRLAQRYPQEFRSGTVLRRVLTAPEFAELEQAFDTYDTECLYSNLAQLPEEIANVAGVLEIGGQARRVFCGATLVGPKTAITNRHCFVDPASGEYAAGCKLLVSPGVYIRFLSALDKPYRIMALETPCPRLKREYNVSDDFIRVTLSEPVIGVRPAKITGASAEVSVGTTFWTAGPSSYVSQTKSTDVMANPYGSVRFASNPSCIVLTRSLECMLHSCQTAPGTSGAGLLLLGVDREVELIGIHAGASSIASQCGDGTPSLSGVNLAVIP